MKILISIIFLFVVASVYGSTEWSDEEKNKAGWKYAKQIECAELAFYSNDYKKSEIHEKEANKILNGIIASGKMIKDEFSGYKSRAIGVTEGIEKTLQIYDKNYPSEYKKVYSFFRCHS
ncbi:hypothetical protein [Pseudoalteromonas sp. S3431]|uniref:hypothetical protein n=1 Tax=Pseudoalteromonas sp. S3431 TaxID=579537 RepID=UPI00049F0B75|nr:hypothetical protein [Pseudoalteromonas sp. S3431]KDC54775.1 hypothetical protein DO88_07025 [Pseudoalteromonas sp. S3431]